MRTIPRCVALLIIVIAALASQQAFAATAREPEEIWQELNKLPADERQ